MPIFVNNVAVLAKKATQGWHLVTMDQVKDMISEVYKEPVDYVVFTPDGGQSLSAQGFNDTENDHNIFKVDDQADVADFFAHFDVYDYSDIHGGTRFLVISEGDNPTLNGIYSATQVPGSTSMISSGTPFVIERTEDANDVLDFKSGFKVFVKLGATHGDETWVFVSDNDLSGGTKTVDGADPITIKFQLDSHKPGGGTGLNLTLDSFNITGDDSTKNFPLNLSVQNYQHIEYWLEISSDPGFHIGADIMNENVAAGTLTLRFDEAPSSSSDYVFYVKIFK
jgi:hypothetical protein